MDFCAAEAGRISAFSWMLSPTFNSVLLLSGKISMELTAIGVLLSLTVIFAVAGEKAAPSFPALFFSVARR